MAEGLRITPADLEMETLHKYAGQTLREAREALERELIQAALVRNKGNITKAAEELGVSRPTLYELMDKVGVGRGEGERGMREALGCTRLRGKREATTLHPTPDTLRTEGRGKKRRKT